MKIEIEIPIEKIVHTLKELSREIKTRFTKTFKTLKKTTKKPKPKIKVTPPKLIPRLEPSSTKMKILKIVTVPFYVWYFMQILAAIYIQNFLIALSCLYPILLVTIYIMFVGGNPKRNPKQKKK